MNAAFVYCATCGAANAPDAQTCFACGNPPMPTTPPASSSASPTGPLATQALVRQRYRLVRQIGRGGFGAVYQAVDTELGNRKVAVKEMSQRGLTPEELQAATQAFHNEALLLAGLTHPNLPRIYEQFSEGGRWYLVMDFIEGETLEALLNRTPGGRLPLPDVLKIGVQLCTVLDYLHMRQPPIIFRDLKPANIMMTPAGDIFLIDFGIARHFKPGQTKDTVAFGSAGYAAPEQYGTAQTTAQSDIYGLGATLHQLISGKDPADSPFVFAPLHLSQPHGLEALIMQMLEANPSKRPASMAVIKQDLERMAGELASKARLPRRVTGAAALATAKAAIPIPPLRPKVMSVPPAPAGASPLLQYRGHRDRINTLAWSPDGQTIASGGNDRSIQLWEPVSGSQLSRIAETDWVHALAWSPDGAQLAWVSQGSVVHLCTVKTGEVSSIALPRMGFFNGLLALSWSPDGTRLAVGGLGKTVEVWEVKTGKRLLTYTGHRRFLADIAIYAVAWSPDGAWIASASTDATIQIWDAVSGKLRCSSRGHQLGYLKQRGAIAWSPDAKFLASTEEKATVHIHDAASGEQQPFLGKHSGTVNTVAWSPNGKYVASGGSDRVVRVWDVATAQLAQSYAGHEGEVNTVAWSPDSTRLASAGDDARVCLWPSR